LQKLKNILTTVIYCYILNITVRKGGKNEYYY